MSDINNKQQQQTLSLVPLLDKVLIPGSLIRLHIKSDFFKDSDNNPNQSDIKAEDLSEKEYYVKTLLEGIRSGKITQVACMPYELTFGPKLSAGVDGPIEIWDHISDLPKSYHVKNRIVCVAKTVTIKKSPVFKNGYFLVLEGICRARIIEKVDLGNKMNEVRLQYINELEMNSLSSKELALYATLKTSSKNLISLLKDLKLPRLILAQLAQLLEHSLPGTLADSVTSMIESDFKEKKFVLEAIDLETRLTKTIEIINVQIKLLGLAKKASTNSQRSRRFSNGAKLVSSSNQDDDDNDLADLLKKLEEAKLPKDTNKMVQREIQRLKRLQPMMADYQVTRNYLEWISELPWSKYSNEQIDIQKAKTQLDSDHFGLNKVKKRILEYLAVCKLRKDLAGPILCLVGPPGVGKTSLGKSIADSLGRSFYRISLGGVRDEAEIRGHRRTYVGAMPGLLIQGLRKCGVSNPVFLLDEIDKVSSNSNQGDPSAALLEVLDPEQNNSFVDHYINTPVDLSKVLFIATANRLDTIPPPLLDRMEVVELSGYTIYEKHHIASKHLIPSQADIHGLPLDKLDITEDALTDVITKYTHEAGVRSLKREIAAICRHKAVDFSVSQEKNSTKEYIPKIAPSDLERILGIAKYNNELTERDLLPGVAIGLVYTGSGSGKIMFLEATQIPGTGSLLLTGKLGEVLKESAQIALSWVKGYAFQLGITTNRRAKLLDQIDIHLHLPEGATPKDGPSAGVALVAALVSLFTSTPLPFATAMTGEITLRGQVLPVGGIKEKVTAAHRAGIKTLLLPSLNRPQVNADDLPAQVLNDITIHFVDTLPQALEILFKLNPWNRKNNFPSNL